MRHRAFPGYGAEVDARYQRAGQWLKASLFQDEQALSWCKVNGLPVRKAAGEGIASSGGYVVPPDLAKAILDIRDRFGAFRRRARIVPMASDSTTVVRRTDGSTAYFIGENAAATASTASADVVSLTAKKVGVLINLSNEIEEDATSDMIDYIANEIAYAFSASEDDCAFNGDGTSTYGTMRGIGQIVLDGFHAKAKVTAAHNTYLTLDSTDLANLVNAVRASAIPNAAWYCSQTCFSQTFIRLAGGTGYLPMAESDGVMSPHYLGFPVILTQKLPLASTSQSGKTMVVFGDMYAGGILGQRRAITLARSSDRYMDVDQIAVLGTQRFHTVAHDLGDNTNFGSLAALVGS